MRVLLIGTPWYESSCFLFFRFRKQRTLACLNRERLDNKDNSSWLPFLSSSIIDGS